MDAPDADRRTEHWRLELDNLHELVAAGMSANTLKAGDRLVVTGSRARNQSRSAYGLSAEPIPALDNPEATT